MRRLLGLLLVTGVFAGCSSPSSDEALGSLLEGVGDVRERVAELQTRVEDLKTRSAETVSIGQSSSDGEAAVLAAISAVAPAEENCDISYGLNSDELSYYKPKGRYGVTWGLPHRDNTIRSVTIECVISEDVHGPDWDRFGTWFEFSIRYPLKFGSHAAVINEQTRSEVAGMVSEYLSNARERVRSYLGDMSSLADDAVQRKGWLGIYGFASLMNEGLYSVHLPSGAHDPGANTSANYLQTLNYDLTTGEQFSLPDMFYPGEASHRAVLDLFIEEHNRRNGSDDRYEPGEPVFSGAIHTWPMVLDPEDFREQQFTLTADALVLDCVRYCSRGIAPTLMFKDEAHAIPYALLADHLDPAGPYRHIRFHNTQFDPAFVSDLIAEEMPALTPIEVFQPVEQVCNGRYLYTPHEVLRAWDTPFSQTGRPGVLRENNIADSMALIDCEVLNEEHFLTHILELRYPLKIQSDSRVINKLVRDAVASGLGEHFATSIDRLPPQWDDEEIQHRKETSGSPIGWVELDGRVTYQNPRIYSAVMHFMIHDPGRNTSADIIKTINYDLFEDREINLSDLFEKGSNWWESLGDALIDQVLSIRCEPCSSEEAAGVRQWYVDEYFANPDYLAGTAFNIDDDHLTLRFKPYEFVDITDWIGATAPVYDVPYEAIEEHLDILGPYNAVWDYP